MTFQKGYIWLFFKRVMFSIFLLRGIYIGIIQKEMCFVFLEKSIILFFGMNGEPCWKGIQKGYISLFFGKHGGGGSFVDLLKIPCQ